jgi:hypothetical protein
MEFQLKSPPTQVEDQGMICPRHKPVNKIGFIAQEVLPVHHHYSIIGKFD